MKTNVALVLGGTSNYAFALGNVLVGLKKFSPNFVNDVIIFHDGLSDQNKMAISKIYNNVIFNIYNKFEDLEKTKSVVRFSRLSLSIYEIFDLLKNYKHVIWLDADTIILSDISDIINYGSVAMVKPGSSALLCDALGFLPEGFDPNTRTRNSGVIVINDKMNYDNLTELCIKKTYEHIKTLRLPDQGIISYCLALTGNTICDLPQKYNMTLNNNSPYPSIIHQAKPEKFWNHGVISALLPEWKSNNEVFIQYGGEPYNGKIKEKLASSLAGSAQNIITFWNAYKIQCSYILEELSNNIGRNYSIEKKNELTYYIKSKIIGDAGRFELMMRGHAFYIKFYTSDVNMIELIKRNKKSINDKLTIKHWNENFTLSYTFELDFDKSKIPFYKDCLIELIDIVEDIMTSTIKKLYSEFANRFVNIGSYFKNIKNSH